MEKCKCGNPSGMVRGALSGEKEIVVKICNDCDNIIKEYEKNNS